MKPCFLGSVGHLNFFFIIHFPSNFFQVCYLTQRKSMSRWQLEWINKPSDRVTSLHIGLEKDKRVQLHPVTVTLKQNYLHYLVCYMSMGSIPFIPRLIW